jgi:hypothetical protein
VRLLSILLLALALPSVNPAREKPETGPVRVLFVGNSLTYVGNLPAVFDALSAANGRHSAGDMIVAGGATLTDRVKDGAVATALAANKYSFVVLQERGGDFTCNFGPDSCESARKALSVLVNLARQHGATALLLGTYQALPDASKEIVVAESRAARTNHIGYVFVSEKLRAARTALPQLQWFASDGMHPGHELALLDALLLYERIYDAHPTAAGFSVEAPIYTPKSGLNAESGTTYDAVEVARLEQQLRVSDKRLPP